VKCSRCLSDNPETSRFCGHCAAPLNPEGEGVSYPTKTVSPPGGSFEKGTLIAGKYRIIGELGRGGMGVVFKAEDTKLKRPVALKLLPHELSHSPDAKERFLREAQAAAALDHPNIGTVFEVGEQDGQAYIAMAYIDGQSLREKIARGPLKIDEALEIAVQVAAGLEEAHRKGIVHRDVKPANVMLTAKGQAKIMDFGLARVESAEDLTRTSVVMGTVAYMSPEQAEGRKVDHRTDIWSFGCLLYEMLAGHRPFQGGHEQAILQSMLHSDPEPIAALRRDIPAGLVKVLDKCLKKNAFDRYPDAGALISDLKSVDLADIASAPAAAVRETAPSIAVLPFSDMSPEKDQDYFGEGIAEELINALTHLQGLRVVARTSAFALKGMKLDIREIGRKLDVGTVLEGSVRKAGNRLRVTAQLINVEDGFHLWSERYDREMSDIFAIQDEITAAIVDSLKVTLRVGEKTALRKRSTVDPEAYGLYLKGLYFFARPSPEAYEKALHFFRAATDKDPNFAAAYAGMASVFAGLGIMNLAPPAEMWPKAKAALQQALSLDEDLAEAHRGAASLAFWFEWDWEAAGRSFDRVLTLNPGEAMSHGQRGWFFVNRRRFDEAIREIKIALELDPLMPLFYAWSVGVHWSVGRSAQALLEFAKALEIDPNNGLAHFHGGVAYFLEGRLDEAIDVFEKGRKLFAPPGWIEAMLGLIYLRKGDREKAERILEETIENKKTVKNVSAPSIAWLAGELGKLDLAFEFLDKAFEERDVLMGFVHVYSDVFSPAIAADPRFKDLLARMKLDG
jgi:TolB-like protein/tetratricopeptide (TPR) repeat protein/predicted Ser/Thr protein kinase